VRKNGKTRAVEDSIVGDKFPLLLYGANQADSVLVAVKDKQAALTRGP